MSNLAQWVIVAVAIIAAIVYLVRRLARPKSMCDGCCEGCKLDRKDFDCCPEPKPGERDLGK